MKLTPEQISSLARLSYLKIDAEAIEVLAKEMSKIMAMVEQVQKVDTSQLSEIVHIDSRTQPLRRDRAVPTTCNLASDAAMEQDGFVVVPKVID